MMSKIKDFWHRNRFYYDWKIFYRKGKPGLILNNTAIEFKEFPVKKNCWGADPLLFEYNGNLYLFFELFDKKKNKGVIAVSVFDGQKFGDYKIIIEEKGHLSFPFVFQFNNQIYLMPETGYEKSIILFKAIDFPYVWERDKLILSGVNSSDSIFTLIDNKPVIIASILCGDASTCYNSYFELDESLKIKELLYKSKKSNLGVRNAGPIFVDNNTFFRSGQYSPNNDYGKALAFFPFNPKNLKTEYSCENKFDGIHTYSCSNNVEIIDVRTKKINSLLKMFFIIMKRIVFKK